jgi:hypothetical protein
MPGFMYFVPETQTEAEARAVLQEAGAGHVIEQPGPDWMHEAAGPRGHGMLAVARGADGELGEVGYRAELQTWQPAPGGRYLVGLRGGVPPGPADLIRARALDGYPVVMGDGRPWIIPVARRYDLTGGELGWVRALPSRRRLNAEGRWEAGEILPRYAVLWRHVERHMGIFERAAGGDAQAVAEAGDFQAENDLVVAALAANYRVGAVEVSLLGLITAEVVVPVLEALIDKPGLDALTKKAQASGAGSTSPGAAAS